jgi:hypothetical protein
MQVDALVGFTNDDCAAHVRKMLGMRILCTKDVCSYIQPINQGNRLK